MTINEKTLQKARINLAGLIKKRRIELGYSQLYVAESIGVKQQSYGRMESGKFFIRYDNLFAICEVLKMKITIEPE